MKCDSINFRNTKNKFQLLVTIITEDQEYEINFDSSFVLDYEFNMDMAKAKVPMIMGLKNRERMKINNHIASSINDYVRFLKL